MSNKKNVMAVINLHETDFLEHTLKALAEEYVRDCVVYNAEGVASRHGKELPTFGFAHASLTSLFKDARNPNYVILAVAEQSKIKAISKRLQKLHKDNRWAASFWFIPITGYFYHKGEI
ncbi:MAG: hypothetical protein KKA19_05345 [Candidatus Margulisbacteria bacterium]|nr:hypothetical protein [Candidatus Margulisiibacteriota bacterium]